MELVVLRLQNRRLWQDLIVAFRYMKGVCQKDRQRLFTRVCSDRIRGNGCKLRESRFTLVLKKKFFTIKMVGHTGMALPKGVVDVLSVEVFKVRLDRALSNLV